MEREARELHWIGNNLQMRHSELIRSLGNAHVVGIARLLPEIQDSDGNR